MRIMIITDSLGLPRKELSYKSVWTDMLSGERLTSKIFNIKANVLRYNEILTSTVKAYGPHGVVLDPYTGGNVEDFILADGHHLNSGGEQLGFDTVYDWIWLWFCPIRIELYRVKES